MHTTHDLTTHEMLPQHNHSRNHSDFRPTNYSRGSAGTAHRTRVDAFIDELQLPPDGAKLGNNRQKSVISFFPDQHATEGGEIFVDPKELEKHF